MIAITSNQLRRAADIKDKIEELQGVLDSILNPAAAKIEQVKRRIMSPEARNKIAAAARRRWREARKAGRKTL